MKAEKLQVVRGERECFPQSDISDDRQPQAGGAYNRRLAHGTGLFCPSFEKSSWACFLQHCWTSGRAACLPAVQPPVTREEGWVTFSFNFFSPSQGDWELQVNCCFPPATLGVGLGLDPGHVWLQLLLINLQ